MSNLRYLFLFTYTCPTHIIMCFVLFALVLCLVYLMLPVSLVCPFLIALSVFSNVYLARTYLLYNKMMENTQHLNSTNI